MARLVYRLHRHATRERSVANQGHHVIVLAFSIASNCHPQGRRERGGSMAGAKSIVFRFIAAQKTTNASILFDGGQQCTPAGKNLMGIRLMTNIPDQPIPRCIESVM